MDILPMQLIPIPMGNPIPQPSENPGEISPPLEHQGLGP